MQARDFVDRWSPGSSAHQLDELAGTQAHVIDLRRVLGVPEVVPLGMDRSSYPDRIVAKPGFEQELARRTLTSLDDARPVWLSQAHAAFDAAVAAACRWSDCTPAMADDKILRRLLALNLERSAQVPSAAASR